MEPKTERTDDRQNRRGRLAAGVAGAALAIGGFPAAVALAQDVPVIERSQLERSIVSDETRRSYRAAYEKAERLDVEPDRNLAARASRGPELIAELAVLEGRVAKAKVEEVKREEARPDFGTPESVGVSQGTLDSIASCESGGDPTVVDASGTYHGKYQFDIGTWASVGGSGLPSEAPEAEQDYRAALLYSQAGSSPWPVCG